MMVSLQMLRLLLLLVLSVAMVAATTACPAGMSCYYAAPAPSNSTQCPTQCGLTQECPCASLQDALDMVPLNATAQCAILAAPGIYAGTGNVMLQFKARPVLLVSEEGAAATTISCSTGEAAFVFDSGETKQTGVSGFTLQACPVLVSNSSTPVLSNVTWAPLAVAEELEAPVLNITDSAHPLLAGCTFSHLGLTITGELYAIISIEGGGATFEDCLFLNNSGDVGAVNAVRYNGVDPVVSFSGCTFERNAGSQLAVAAFASSVVTFDECTFHNNTVASLGTLLSTSSSMTITNSRFTNCASGVVLSSRMTGFGFKSHDGPSNLVLFNVTMISNMAFGILDLGGGAILTEDSNVTMTSCTIANNTAPIGGAICFSTAADTYLSTLSISDSVFMGNMARSVLDTELQSLGGAIFVNSGKSIVDVKVDNSSFIENGADQAGGAVWMFSRSKESTLTVSNCTLDQNTAYRGAGVMSYVSTVFSNGTLFRNHEAFQGSAFSQMGGRAVVLDVTFADNRALDAGGAILVDGPTTVYLSDCSMVYNSAANFGGAMLVASNTSVAMVNCSLCDNETKGSGGAISVGVDRDFSSPSSTGYLSLENCSFLRNHARAGGALSLSDEGMVSMDGVTLESNSATLGGALAMQDLSSGAFSRSIFQRNTATYAGAVFLHSNRSSAFENVTLEFNAASISAGAIGISGESETSFNQLLVSRNVAGQQGGGIDITSVSPVVFTETTISNNTATTGGGLSLRYTAAPFFLGCKFLDNEAMSFGGGVAASQHSQPKFTDCTFTRNTADAGGAFRGGDSSAAVLERCTFSFNHAYQGGAINLSSNATFTDCSVSSNVAKTRGGGFLFLDEARGGLNNVTIVSNTAVDGGGIGLTDNASPMLSGCLFSSNTAIVQGGGVLTADWSDATFAMCTFSKNRAVTGTGGAVSIVDFSAPAFLGGTFFNNTAENGGAVYSISASNNPSFVDTVFYANLANGNGGAASLHGISQVIMTNCSFLSNNARASGGAVNVEDRSLPELVSCQFLGNEAENNGGGIVVQALSNPLIRNCTVVENTSDNGGGIHFMPDSLGRVENCYVARNLAVFGAGIYVAKHNAALLRDLVIADNSAQSSGGGIALEAFNSVAFTNCAVFDNEAQQGGGVFVSSPISGSSDSSPKLSSQVPDICQAEAWPEFIPIPPHQPIINSTFEGMYLVRNRAAVGGGVFFSGIDPGIRFSKSHVAQNSASGFGGGAYFFSTAGTAMNVFDTTSFVANNATYGGGTAAWPGLDTDAQMNFCWNCTYVNNTAGYQNSDGLATAPVNMTFEEDFRCPKTEMLNNQTFSLAVGLQDFFGTIIAGPYLEDNELLVELSLAEASCGLFPQDELEARMSALSGAASFVDVSLSGKNNASCTLVFDVGQTTIVHHTDSLARNLPITISPTTINSISCNVTLSGCPSGEDVISDVNSKYDTCGSNGVWNTVNLLIVVIGLLVILVLVLILVQLLVWYRRRLATKWGEELTVPDIYNKQLVTLQDILSDPDIPHIAWDQLTVCEKIGFGASAIVKRGLWTPKTGPVLEVALKQLLLGIDSITSDMLKEFLVEIKLTSAMNHDNVVRLIGMSCSPDKDIYLVTELMSHGSIRDVLDKKGRNLRWDVRLKLACDAAKGMSYLHSRSVIHRDLKPGNLLVTSNWMCKVADFGASTIKAATTQTMTVVGTPAYMAPEVLARSKYSEKADVYSFGVILAELYTGKRPYTGPEFDDIHNQIQLIYRILNENLKPDTTGLPAALLQLVYDCWNEEPELRPSFSEIIVRLRRLRTLELHSMDAYPGEEQSEIEDTIDLDWIELNSAEHLHAEVGSVRSTRSRIDSIDAALDRHMEPVTSTGREDDHSLNLLRLTDEELSEDDEGLNPMAISAMILLKESTEQEAIDREAAQTPLALSRHLLSQGHASSPLPRLPRNMHNLNADADTAAEQDFLLGDLHFSDFD